MTGAKSTTARLVLVFSAVTLAMAATVAYGGWFWPEYQRTYEGSTALPDVTSSWMVYLDQRSPGSYDPTPADTDDDDELPLYQVRALNLQTMQPKVVTPGKTAMGEPAVAGHYVVWPDYGNGTTTKGIWYYNLETGTRKLIIARAGTPSHLELSGHRLVYEYKKNVYTYNLWTKTHIKLTSSGWNLNPDISGTKVVWVKDHTEPEGEKDSDIYWYDILTEDPTKAKSITDFHYDGASSPAISGNVVAWEDDRNGNYDIYRYDLSTKVEARVTTDLDNQRTPAVSGTYIVWREDVSPDQTWLYDIRTGQTKQVTNNGLDNSDPAISGERIVYVRHSAMGDRDIFLTQIKTPELLLNAPAAIPSGTQTLVRGALLSGAVAMPSEAVSLEISKDKVNWVVVATTSTGADGSYSMYAPAFTTRRYMRTRYAGGATYPSSVSKTSLVRARIGFTSAPKFADYSQTYGRTYKVWGYFKPKHSAGSKQIKVRAYRWNGSSYVYKKTYYTKVSNPSGSDYSKYTGYIRLPSKGTWRLRAYHAADSNNAKSFSVYRSVKVK